MSAGSEVDFSPIADGCQRMGSDLGKPGSEWGRT